MQKSIMIQIGTLAATLIVVGVGMSVIGCSDHDRSLAPTSPARMSEPASQTEWHRSLFEDSEVRVDWSEHTVTMRALMLNPEVYDGQKIAIIGEPQVTTYSCELGFCMPYPCCVECDGLFSLTEDNPQGGTVELILEAADDEEFWYCVGSRCAFEGDENFEFDSYPFPSARDNGVHWFGGVFRDETPAGYPWRVWKLYVEDYGRGSNPCCSRPPKPPKHPYSPGLD